ncbi:MAG: lambda exonuclease family protein [Mycetocola sp.]
MTLHTYDYEQGSDEWLAARCGVLTASVIGKMLTPSLKVADNETSRGIAHTLIAERITGRTEDVYVTADMERGTLDEPYARDIYSEHYASVTEVGFMVRKIDGRRLGYSPDGLVGEEGLVEIKSRKQKVQLATILTNRVPTENMAQLQAGLLVSGRAWIDYLSYCGGMPLYVIRVYPESVWQDALLEALHTFEDTASDAITAYTTVTAGLPTTERIDHYLEMSI